MHFLNKLAHSSPPTSLFLQISRGCQCYCLLRVSDFVNLSTICGGELSNYSDTVGFDTFTCLKDKAEIFINLKPPLD